MPNLSVAINTTRDPIDDWLNELTKNQQKEQEPIHFKDDPVAMACAGYRAWKTNFINRWADLDAVVVQPEDRVTASELKAYYRGRMTFQALRNGVALSAYRKKLAAIVADTHVYTKQDLGILHRLPYFYDEDRAVDQVLAQTQNPAQIITDRDFEGLLRPCKRVLRSRRAGEWVDFYFTGSHSTAPYLLVVRADNPLISIIEALFKQPEIKLRAHVHAKRVHGYHHNRILYQLALPEVL